MSLTSEQLARIAAIAAEAATPPSPPTAPVEPARVLPQTAPAAPSPPASAGPSLDDVRRVVREEFADRASFGLLPNPPAPGTPPVTGGAAAGGAAPDALRDPYNLSEDDVNVLINRHGYHGAGQRLMQALREAPRRRLLVRKR